MLRKSHFVKSIIFLGIFMCLLLFVSNILEQKGAMYRMQEFHDQKEDFDVLFMGSSHVHHGIIPTELWQKYGIVSYNLGVPAERLTGTYYNLQLALQETKPKLVVVDVYQIGTKEKYENTEKLHRTFDGYPISWTKYNAIKEIMDDDANLLSNEIEFLFKFPLYHNRWSSLDEDDFKEEKYIKGGKMYAQVEVPPKPASYDSVEALKDIDSIDIDNLEKIISYAKSEGVEVLLTYIPTSATKRQVAISKYLEDYTKKNNINYVNYLATNLVDNDIHYFDKVEGNAHLNIAGAKIVTDAIGQYIISHYAIQDRKNQVAYKSWNDSYNEYADYKIDLMKKTSGNLYSQLISLYNETDIRYKITLVDNEYFNKNKIIHKLLNELSSENIVVDKRAFANNSGKSIKITTWDSRNDKEIQTVWF